MAHLHVFARQRHGLVRVDIAWNLKRGIQSEEKCKQGMFEQKTECYRHTQVRIRLLSPGGVRRAIGGPKPAVRSLKNERLSAEWTFVHSQGFPESDLCTKRIRRLHSYISSAV